MKRRVVLAVAVLALLALAAGAWPLWRAARAAPMLDVHTRPWATHAGRLRERHPLGQRFRSADDGLRRIDVALVSLRPAPRGSLRLRLWADDPRGELLREVSVTPPPDGVERRWLSFAFDPLPDSAGRVFHFELLPAGDVKPAEYSTVLRYHGHVGHAGSWSDHTFEGPLLEGLVRPSMPPGPDANQTEPTRPEDVPHAWLRAISFGVVRKSPLLGEAKLELWREGEEDGPPLRTATLDPEDELESGWCFFAFEPLADSRWQRYTYRLSLPPGTILDGDRWGPAMMTWHGLDGGDPDLLGATVGGAARPDRDVIFRAFGRPDAGFALGRMAGRMGWRLWAGAALWLAAAAAVVAPVVESRTELRCGSSS